MKPRHVCGDECVCPVDMNPLFYNQAQNVHACQDPDCEFANGFEEGVVWLRLLNSSEPS
ncbi:hypothetical protein GCM10018783_73780 [Streptomyces griseosporeus]|nr:hypothetical protein GCM10018783_73780 [Streptomyces griseosporeus]